MRSWFLCIVFDYIIAFLRCKGKHCIKCINVFQRKKKKACFWFSLNMFSDDAKYFVCSSEQSAHWVDDFRKLPESPKYSSWTLTSTFKFIIFKVWFMFYYLLFTHINYHLAFLYSKLEFTNGVSHNQCHIQLPERPQYYLQTWIFNITHSLSSVVICKNIE